MSQIRELISALKQDWSFARKSKYCNDSFELLCLFNNKGLEFDLKESASKLGIKNIPIKHLNFIKETNGAKLFYDKTYGQAGMYLYGTDVIYEKNLEWRNGYLSQDLLSKDLIIGEFFGDNDLIILRCDKNSSDYGNIIILLPLDEREDWYFLDEDFESFLVNFCNKEGIKYWEFL
ncbi:SMI1/KNR4 family protein [Moraxella bovoculi]|uniref:SMI1/KNR4 family protein n=1 Tax=Moraxella bovoculi TaxID=386891 RepID=UPI003F50CDF9